MKSASRDVEADSVKGALILLVVTGHIVDIFSGTSAVYLALDSALTAFRMPLFLLIVGMYSRANLTDKDFRAMFSLLILPLLLFQVAYLLPLWLVTGKLLVTVLTPYFHLWFLLAIILMKLGLVLAVRIRFALPAAVALTLVAGYDPGIGFSFALSRTLYFFPFFLMGHLYGREIFSFVKQHAYLFIAAFVLTMAAVCVWSVHGLPRNSLNGAVPYAQTAVIASAPALGRAIALCLSLVAALGFLALVPKQAPLLVYLGQRSMVVYICHGFFILALTKMVQGMRDETALLLLPAWLLLATALCFSLARFNAPFKRAFAGAAAWMLDGRQTQPAAELAPAGPGETQAGPK